MFCPKCGMKAVDGGVFCQKCGERLIVDENKQSTTGTTSVKQAYSQIHNSSVDIPKKKKTRKFLIILGIIVLAVAAMAVASGIWDGETDYIATVKEHKPFEKNQGLDGTFADVLEQYMVSPAWEVRESGDIHYVDISGIIKETDYVLAVTIKVSPDPDDADRAYIRPESIVFNNKENLSINGTEEFLHNMFSAYNKGCKDLSGLLSGTESQGILLSETYTDDEEGFSFHYSSTWIPVSEEEYTSQFGNIGDEEYPLIVLVNENGDLPEENIGIMVSRFDSAQDHIDYLFIDDEQFAAGFDDDVTVKHTSTTEVDGVAAREITYLDKNGNGCQSYFYAVGSVFYRIDFGYKEESAGSKQKFFDAVIGSYKITADETAAGKNDSAAAGKNDSAAGKLIYADKLLYNGVPVDTIMEMKAEDVIAAFGEADEYSDENFIQILSEDGERLVAMANFDSAGYVSYFAGDPEKYELNGQNLNHDYDRLVEIFGREPDSQEMYDLLEIKWFYDNYSILIGLDNDGLPGKAEVWKEDETNDGVNEQNQTGFNRADYFTAIPINDMLRNPDSYYNSCVFYDHFTVKELIEPRLYIAKDESSLQNYSGKYIVIDDRNHEGVNAIVGDQVTVYGRFTGTTTIDFMDGSSQQCVVITADRFIDNAEMVTDMQDFAQAIVANMNQPAYDEKSEYLFGTGSRYISDTSVQLILGVRCTNIIEPDISWITPRKNGEGWLFGSVDGYSVCIDAEYAPDLVMPWDAGIEVEYDEIVAMRVNGKIKSVEPYMGSSYVLEVTLYVESFEPY